MGKNISYKKASIFSGAVLALGCASVTAGPNDTDWIQLWTGSNLSDWDLKFRGYALNVNLNNTFRTVTGTPPMLEVNYTGYTTNFGGDAGPFGHAAYKLRTFSWYLLYGEYQVWGTQVTGGPPWANQNNGFMLHSQSAASMGLNQDFPASLEAQLLGPANSTATPGAVGTMNLCTPGTQFYNNPTGGAVNTTHCTAAAANPRAPINTGWMYVSALVLGDSVVRFYVGTATNKLAQNVFTFYRPVLDNQTRLTQGYVHIQAESAPYRFRVINVAVMEGCMNSSYANYKTYFVHSNPALCTVPIAHSREGLHSHSLSFDAIDRKLHIDLDERFSAKITDLLGKTVWEKNGSGNNIYDLGSIQPRGIYLLTLAHGGKSETQKLMLGR